MQAAQTANPPSFETVWALFQETDRLVKEVVASQKETDKIVKEVAASQLETDRLFKEVAANQKETDQIVKESKMEYDRRIGHLDNNFGELAEYMIAPKLREKFLEFALDFPKTNRNVVINDIINKIALEIDIMLENGDKAMLVEAKAKITIERINNHLKRLEKMRKYSDLHGDKRTFLGAIGGVIVNEEAKNYALGQGLFFIEPAGDSFYITAPNSKPKEW